MIKKYIIPVNIIFLLWGPILIVISEFYREYVRYFLYLSIIAIIPIMVLNLIKQRREDKLNAAKVLFRQSIYRMLIMAVVLVVFYFLTHQKHI